MLLFFAPILSFSCKQKKPMGFRERKIELNDSLGTITINLPARLEKYNSWSDNEVYQRIFYRFNDNDYPVVKEAKSYNLDSIYQFTIWQTDLTTKEISQKSCFSNIDSLKILGKPLQVTEHYTKYFLREFRLINNTLFSIEAYKTTSFSPTKTTLFVIATTCYKDKKLIFVSECRGKDTTGFIDNLYKSILSIQIK